MAEDEFSFEEIEISPNGSVFLPNSLPEQWQSFFDSINFKFSMNDDCNFKLIEKNDKFFLVMKPNLEFSIDFLSQHLIYNKKIVSPKKELLYRAIGVKTKVFKVLDLTAGLGQDAIFLSKLGCQVLALERHPILYFLLEKAWESLPADMKERLQFKFLDSQVALNDFSFLVEQSFDAIYYDPMYPEKKKSALPRKEMQVFRALVGPDSDCADVLDKALRSGVRRVVVKRPRLGSNIELISGRVPHHSLEGNLIRFDVYLNSQEENL